MTHLARYAPCALLLLLSACADSSGDYPSLMPTDQLLAEPELPAAGSDPVATNNAANSRAEALRSRADSLRGPVIEPDLKRRFDDIQG